MFTVYALRSIVNKRLYIGHTKDIKRRLLEHNSGKSKYTSTTRPFVLVYSEQYLTRSKAMKREKVLKSGKGKEWLKSNLGGAVA